MSVDLKRIIDHATTVAIRSVTEELNRHGGTARYLGHLEVTIHFTDRDGQTHSAVQALLRNKS